MTSHILSYIGQVRSLNEDYTQSIQTSNFEAFIVCDGMGGHARGDVASKLACETAIRFLEENKELAPTVLLERCILEVNKTVFEKSQSKEEYNGMGTTIVIALIQDNTLFYANVGDSRLYLIRKQKLEQLSKDHSYVAELVEGGIITKEEAWNHPKKNVITQAIGLKETVKPFISKKSFHLKSNDILLLCTDGLYDMVREDEIREVMITASSMEQAAQTLVDKANGAGGKDNITVSLIYMNKATITKKRKRFLWVFIALLLLISIFILSQSNCFLSKENRLSNTEEIEIENKTEIQSDSQISEENSVPKISPKNLNDISYDLSCMSSESEGGLMDFVNFGSLLRDNVIDIGTEEVSIAEEEEAGRKFHEQIIKEKEIKANSRLSAILSAIQKNYFSKYHYKIYEIKDESLNAFTFGGYIYVHSGMLDFVKNNDELASIVAHEISHNEQGHITKTLRTQKSAQQLFGESFSNVLTFVERSLTTPFNQKDEVMADLLGVDLMIRAGYNPCSAIEIWRRMAKDEGDKNSLEELFRTHPYSSNRVICIRHHLDENYGVECDDR